MKGIIDKERLKEIGRYLERQIIIHRNVENDTKWNNEELMIVDLFDNYVELICEINNLQKENQKLKEQLQQKENIIELIIKFCRDNQSDDLSWENYSAALEDILNLIEKSDK